MDTALPELPASLLRVKDAKIFEPKLSAQERCEVLAAYHMGVRTDALALAYSLNRRTVTHLVNPRGVHYKDTKKEMVRLGKDEFVKQYFTEEVAARIRKVEHRPEMQKETSQRHNRKAGVHIVKPDQCAYSHRIEVKYLTDRDPRGWYVRDLDSKTSPEEWYHNGQDSLATSQNALALAEANLVDG